MFSLPLILFEIFMVSSKVFLNFQEYETQSAIISSLVSPQEDFYYVSTLDKNLRIFAIFEKDSPPILVYTLQAKMNLFSLQNSRNGSYLVSIGNREIDSVQVLEVYDVQNKSSPSCILSYPLVNYTNQVDKLNCLDLDCNFVGVLDQGIRFINITNLSKLHWNKINFPAAFSFPKSS